MKSLIKALLAFLRGDLPQAEHRPGARSASQAVKATAGSEILALPRAPMAPDWTPECQGAWLNFLKTPAGAVLRERMRAVEAEVARNACVELFHTQHAAGVAKGFGDARAWLESLSRTSRVNDESHLSEVTNVQDQDEPPRGEAAWREKLSP